MISVLACAAAAAKRFWPRRFPPSGCRISKSNVPHYRHLSPTEQARLRDDLRVFIAEKNWEGCAGLTVTDEMKVTIAAQACLMTLGLDGEPFRDVLSMLIYPSRLRRAGRALVRRLVDRAASRRGWASPGIAGR